VADTVVDGHAHGESNAFLDGASLDFVTVDALREVDNKVIACLADIEHDGTRHAQVRDGLDDGVTDNGRLLVLGDNVGVSCGR
jgi:hypothetical protein